MQLTLPDDDPAFKQAVEILASRPALERAAITSFIFLWVTLSGELRAVIAKIIRPEMRDAEVARIAGVNRCSLSDWDRYQRIKPMLNDIAKIKSCGCKRRKTTRGTWPLIDDPDAE